MERVESRGLAFSLDSASSWLCARGHITQPFCTSISSSVKEVIMILAHLSPLKGGDNIYLTFITRTKKMISKVLCAIQIERLSKPTVWKQCLIGTVGALVTWSIGYASIVKSDDSWEQCNFLISETLITFSWISFMNLALHSMILWLLN